MTNYDERSSAWEDLGYVPSEPERNRRIREHFGLEAKTADAGSPILFGKDEVANAARAFLVRSPLERPTSRYIHMMLAKLGKTSYPVKRHYNMTAAELRQYFSDVTRDLRKATKKLCPEVLEEIDVINDDLSGQYNHL